MKKTFLSMFLSLLCFVELRAATHGSCADWLSTRSAREPFIQAILASPEDNALRLIYADWLEERGIALAQLIRFQISSSGSLATDPPSHRNEERKLLAELFPRIHELNERGRAFLNQGPPDVELGQLGDTGITLRLPNLDLPGDWLIPRLLRPNQRNRNNPPDIQIVFERGFLSEVRVTPILTREESYTFFDILREANGLVGPDLTLTFEPLAPPNFERDERTAALMRVFYGTEMEQLEIVAMALRMSAEVDAAKKIFVQCARSSDIETRNWASRAIQSVLAESSTHADAGSFYQTELPQDVLEAIESLEFGGPVPYVRDWFDPLFVLNGYGGFQRLKNFLNGRVCATSSIDRHKNRIIAGAVKLIEEDGKVEPKELRERAAFLARRASDRPLDERSNLILEILSRWYAQKDSSLQQLFTNKDFGNSEQGLSILNALETHYKKVTSKRTR